MDRFKRLLDWITGTATVVKSVCVLGTLLAAAAAFIQASASDNPSPQILWGIAVASTAATVVFLTGRQHLQVAPLNLQVEQLHSEIVDLKDSLETKASENAALRESARQVERLRREISGLTGTLETIQLENTALCEAVDHFEQRVGELDRVAEAFRSLEISRRVRITFTTQWVLDQVKRSARPSVQLSAVVQAILGQIESAMRTAVDSKDVQAFLKILARDGETHLEMIASELNVDRLPHEPLPIEGSIAGYVYTHRESLLFDHLDDPRVKGKFLEKSCPGRSEFVCSGMLRPVFANGEVTAVLCAVSTKRAAFREELWPLLNEAAESLGAGYQNVAALDNLKKRLLARRDVEL